MQAYQEILAYFNLIPTRKIVLESPRCAEIARAQILTSEVMRASEQRGIYYSSGISPHAGIIRCPRQSLLGHEIWYGFRAISSST